MKYRDGIDLEDENNSDDDDGGQSRYYFPKGCKGIDVLIDNSSRLRALKFPVDHQIARLPVTLKTTTPDSYLHSTPPNSYIPPGPLNIYRPDQIIYTTSKPSNIYIPPANEPSNAFLPPPDKPSLVFQPPKETATTRQPTSIAYIPQQITKKPPIAAYLSSANISSIYLPSKPMIGQQPDIMGANELHPPAQSNENYCYCDEKSSAKLIIPVPLKTIAGLPQLYGQLIVPLQSLDEESKAKLSQLNLETDKIDIKKLIGIVFNS